MKLKEDIIKIINKVSGIEEFYLEKHIVIDKEKEIFIMSNEIFIRISIVDNSLILEDILLEKKSRGKKIVFKLIEEMIKYSKNENLDEFIVSNIISNKMYKICSFYGMKDEKVINSLEFKQSNFYKAFNDDNILITKKIITKENLT